MSKSKWSVAVLGIAFTLALVFSVVSSRAGAGEPPANVTISVIKDTKSAVAFPHAAHSKVLQGKCADCHTTATGGPLKAEFVAKPANMGAAMSHPFHKECKDCHVASGNPKAPTACADCHK